MSASEVFRPTAGGNLLVRSGLNTGLEQSADVFRKSNSMSRQMAGSRPATSCGFGKLSHSSFFARHNPHPGRVRHIKGLLDVPICAVNDEGQFANPRHSLQFPPNHHDEMKLKSYNTQYYNVPVGAINVNSQLHPIDTLSGIQKFVGSAMNGRIFREKAVNNLTNPNVPLGEAWREELEALTSAVGAAGLEDMQRRPPSVKPRTAQYSTTTGRLIPPPSRAMSRGNSRAARREVFFNKLQNISDNPDIETMIMQMLCQILQTEDAGAVQAWLVSAGDREKSMVLDMIRAALVSNEEYYKQYNAEQYVMNDRPRSAAPFNEAGVTIGEMDGDRLTLDNVSPRPMSQVGEARDPLFQIEEEPESHRPPLLPDLFQVPRSAGSRLGRPRSQGGVLGPGPEPKLRYTTSPVIGQPPASPLMPNGQSVWNPDSSMVNI